MRAPTLLPLIAAATFSPFAAAADDVDLGSLSTDGVTLVGPSVGSKTGVAVAGGIDLDADGRDDLAIGALAASPLGRTGAGVTFVVLDANAAPHAVDLSSASSRVIAIYGGAPGDALGVAIAGPFDFDGDGVDDLAVAAWQADPLGRQDAGEVSIILGRVGITGSIDLAASPPGVVRIVGAQTGDGLGARLAVAGDVDGDGRDDLVLGAPLADRLGRTDAGAAWIVFGRTAPPSVIDLASAGNAAVTIVGAAPGDRLGDAVCGRLVRQGTPAVALGAPFADPFSRPSAGEVFIVPWTASSPTTIDLAAPPIGVLRVRGATSGDLTGASLAWGDDRDGDGAPELVVGSMRALTAAGPSTGRVDVIRVDGGVLDVDLATDVPAFRVLGAHAGAQLGNAVADSFDADGDGFSDIIAGMRGFDAGPDVDIGAGVVVARPVSPPSQVDLTAAPQGVRWIVGDQPLDRAGYAISGGGDVDGSGFVDVLIGAINATPGPTATTGAAYAVFDGVTPAKLGVTVNGSAFAGGSVLVAVESSVGTAASFLVSTAIAAPPIPVHPYSYALALSPAGVAIVASLPLAAGQGSVTIPFPSIPALQGATIPVQVLAKDASGTTGAFSNSLLIEVP